MLNGTIASSSPAAVRYIIGYTYIGIDHTKKSPTQVKPNTLSTNTGSLTLVYAVMKLYSFMTVSSITMPKAWVQKKGIAPDLWTGTPAEMSMRKCMTAERENMVTALAYFGINPRRDWVLNTLRRMKLEMELNLWVFVWCQKRLQTRWIVCLCQSTTMVGLFRLVHSPPKTPQRVGLQRWPIEWWPIFRSTWAEYIANQGEEVIEASLRAHQTEENSNTSGGSHKKLVARDIMETSEKRDILLWEVFANHRRVGARIHCIEYQITKEDCQGSIPNELGPRWDMVRVTVRKSRYMPDFVCGATEPGCKCWWKAKFQLLFPRTTFLRYWWLVMSDSVMFILRTFGCWHIWLKGPLTQQYNVDIMEEEHHCISACQRGPGGAYEIDGRCRDALPHT